MACSGSRSDDLKVSEVVEKESNENKLWLKNGMKVSKSKTKKRKLSKRSKRVSKFESEEDKLEAKKRRSRIRKYHKNKLPKKMNRQQVLEARLKEREIIHGADVVAFDRDDPSRCVLGDYLKSLVDLAIDFYNKNNSKDYRMVYMVRAIQVPCQGSLFFMTMAAKLPNQDDADAVTFEAEVYRGIPDTVVKLVRILDSPPALSPLTA